MNIIFKHFNVRVIKEIIISIDYLKFLIKYIYFKYLLQIEF